MVVSNTSPLNYLILISEIDVLAQLYYRVIIPQSVAEELQARETPEAVQSWIQNHPEWLGISAEVGSLDSTRAGLHAGERDAISLALNAHADALLIDERLGRDEAEGRGIKVIGTIGVLVSAHERGLLNLVNAISRLQDTSFHIAPKLLSAVLENMRMPILRVRMEVGFRPPSLVC